jgi:uncharacterized membrane protein
MLAVVYLCVAGIDFASFYHFSDGVILFFFLAIALSLLRFTASGYPFGILAILLSFLRLTALTKIPKG